MRNRIDKKKPLEEQLNTVRSILGHGDVKDVEELVKRGLGEVANIREGDHDSAPDFTPLHYAAKNKNTEVFIYLVNKFKLNPDGGEELTPLLNAAHAGNYPLIRLLIEKYHVDVSKKNAFEKDVIGILESQHHFRYIESVQKLIEQQKQITSRHQMNSDLKEVETTAERQTLKFPPPKEENQILKNLRRFSALLFSQSKAGYEKVPLLEEDSQQKKRGYHD